MFNIKFARLLVGVVCTLLTANAYTDKFSDDASGLLAKYISVDTVNPPGNESNGVDFFAEIFDKAGVPFESAESAPGRGNIWAVIRGGDKPGLVLLHHMDVVPANKKYWETDPYSGVIKEGYVYGRGALDTKGLGILHLQAFLALKASNVKPSRDVWFVATADEEAGGLFGAGWLQDNRPEIFSDVGYLINEGGSGRVYGDSSVFLIETTQKVPLWLRLTASGNPGHGSSPQTETSVTRLLRAGDKIANTQFETHVIDPVQAMFHGMAPYSSENFRQANLDIRTASRDPKFMKRLQLENPSSAALLRNTCSITRLQGSAKINVVPAEVMMELDCRLLPDQSPEDFTRQLAELINDENIRIETLISFSPAVSGVETPLYRALGRVLQQAYPGVAVVPSVSTGFTDSHFFRDAGIASYGFSPLLLPLMDFRGIHGNNERVSVENMQRGVQVMRELLNDFVTE